MTPSWPFAPAQDALKSLHLVVIPLKGIRKAITLWGDDLIDTEIITRELRRVLTVVCELDDRVAGRWRRRLWVTG